MKKILTLIIFIFISQNIWAQKEMNTETEFEKTVKIHLQSIDEKNYDNFISTITEKNDFNLIMPNGVHISSKKQFLDFTKAWFAETTWKMKYTILNLKETSEMGFVFLMINYSDVNEKNEPYSLVYYLNLIFEKQSSGWKLVHDQNTMCYDKNLK